MKMRKSYPLARIFLQSARPGLHGAMSAFRPCGSAMSVFVPVAQGSPSRLAAFPFYFRPCGGWLKSARQRYRMAAEPALRRAKGPESGSGATCLRESELQARPGEVTLAPDGAGSCDGRSGSQGLRPGRFSFGPPGLRTTRPRYADFGYEVLARSTCLLSTVYPLVSTASPT